MTTWRCVIFLMAMELGVAAATASADTPMRSLKICVAASAPDVVRQGAKSVLDSVDYQPLLRVIAGSKPPTTLTDTTQLLEGPAGPRAFNHLVLVGLLSDPAIQAVWQRQARPIDNGSGLYIFGFGNLDGDIGYVESDRNPFLHSVSVGVAPFETQIVTITGTTPAGVALAVNAFLHQGLVNGVVAAPGWKRSAATILDRDPLPANFALPSCIPAQSGGAQRIAVTQSGEDEYRGVLADTGIEPRTIWRAKYYMPGAWDGVGDKGALTNFVNGLHRLAYGNTLWCAQFADDAEARSAAPKIAAAAGLRPIDGGAWKGDQPAYTSKAAAGSMRLWTIGGWVFMSTIPDSAVAQRLPRLAVPSFASTPAIDARTLYEIEVSPSNARYMARHLVTVDPISGKDGLLVESILKTSTIDDATWMLPGLRTAAAPWTDGGLTIGWIADMSVPMASFPGTTAPVGLTAGRVIRANFVRLDQRPMPNGSRQMVAMAWSPVVWGRPHRSPQALGYLVLIAR